MLPPTFILLALALQAESPFQPPEFRTPDGIGIQLWAEAPLIHNPTAIDIDERGRVWCTEGVRYRRWGGRNPGLERAGDRVVIVSDEDGDGRADRSHVFVEDPDLVAPLGLLVLDGVVLVSSSPHLFAYFDDDGDDVSDRRETLLTGFGGFDHDHGLHSAVLGPDGALYLAVGNAGPHLVTDAAGWSLASGSIYTGGGPVVADNKPGLVSDDGRAWTGGLMLRVERDGSGLRVLAHNFRNPYELAVDPFGRMWTADNDDDGNRGCRATWVLPAGDHGYFSADGSRYWQADRRPGQTTSHAHWHADDPGVAPSGTIYGAGSPTGVTYIGDGPLAERLGETLVTADAGRGIVFAWRIEADGSGWRLDERRLVEPVRESPGADRFRPSDVTLAPDGSLFIADWYDPAVGGHYAGDRASRGNLYRVASKRGHAAAPPSAMKSVVRAVGALGASSARVRQRARPRLASAPDEAAPLLATLARQGTPLEAARALWILGEHDPQVLVEALHDADTARLREAALNVLLRYHGDEFVTLARKHGWASSPHGHVRRAVAMSLVGRPLENTLKLVLQLAAAHEPGDRAGLEAFGAAVRGSEEALWPELVLAEGKQATEWSRRFVDIAWRLHPRAATSAWRARALEPRLDVEERRRALDALAFTPGRAAAEAVVAAHLAGPEDLAAYARWWLEQRNTNEWAEYALLDELPGGRADLAQATELWRSAPIGSGVVTVDVVLEEAARLWLVVDSEGSNGYDWADWIEPRLEVDGELVGLASLPWNAAEAGWGGVYVDRNAANSGPLTIEGRELSGIGTHAPSAIVWDLPRGATRFLARAGIDDGGARQPGARPLVHFAVLAELAEVDALAPHMAAFEGGSAQERADAIRALATDARGGMWLVRRASTDAFDTADAELAAEHIFGNPDPAVRALASGVFERPGEEQLPSIEELLALDGDPERGRELFLSTRTQCARCHTFELDGFRRGGALGPDLTMVREKFGRDGLFDAILNPSAAIAFGYETWMIEDDTGRLFTGFVLADGDLVVLKDTQGERHAIPADSIVYRQSQALSTMPTGIATGLAPEELADLVAFLHADPATEPAYGPWQDLFNGEDLAGWEAFSPEGEADWRVAAGALVTSGMPLGYLRTTRRFTDFQLELEWRFDATKGPGNSGVLLRVHGEDRVWPKSIEAQLHHRDAGDIWNIGEFSMETTPERTEGRRTRRRAPSSELPLGEWNRYRITLDRGTLVLEVNGVEQNRAGWCEAVPGWIALQAEGAEIQFRSIRLREPLGARVEGR